MTIFRTDLDDPDRVDLITREVRRCIKVQPYFSDVLGAQAMNSFTLVEGGAPIGEYHVLERGYPVRATVLYALESGFGAKTKHELVATHESDDVGTYHEYRHNGVSLMVFQLHNSDERDDHLEFVWWQVVDD